MSAARKWQRECLEYARNAGIRDARIERGAKHDKLLGTANGAPFMQILSRSSVGEWHCRQNVRAAIKRAVRAQNQEH